MSFIFDQVILQVMVSYFLAGSVIGPVMSQSLLDFMICLIFSCFIIQSIKLKFKNFSDLRTPYLFEFGFIFYFLAVVVGYVVLDINASEWLKLTRFSWIINFYLFAWAISHVELNLTKIINFLTWGFIVQNIYALFSLFYSYDFVNKHPLSYFRIVGLLGSSTYHAHSNGLISIFFLTLLVFKFKDLSKSTKIASGLALLIMFLSILLTFTRGVWIGLLISMLCLIWVQNRKFFIALILGVATLSIISYNFSESFRERIGISTNTQQIKHAPNGIPVDTRSSDAFRVNLLKLHFKMFQASPLVGIGYVNNLSHTPIETWEKFGFPSSSTIDTHAHNQFMNNLTLTGIIGFIPFMLFYLWFLLTNLKLTKKFKKEGLKNHYILAVACLMTQLEYMIANMTDVGFEYSKIRSLILIVWAIVFVLWKNKAKFSLLNT